VRSDGPLLRRGCVPPSVPRDESSVLPRFVVSLTGCVRSVSYQDSYYRFSPSTRVASFFYVDSRIPSPGRHAILGLWGILVRLFYFLSPPRWGSCVRVLLSTGEDLHGSPWCSQGGEEDHAFFFDSHSCRHVFDLPSFGATRRRTCRISLLFYCLFAGTLPPRSSPTSGGVCLFGGKRRFCHELRCPFLGPRSLSVVHVTVERNCRTYCLFFLRPTAMRR